MTKFLEKAFAQASKLPEEDQDTFAAFLLFELGSERKWEELFSSSQDELASEALSEPWKGKTSRLHPENL